MNAIPTRPVLPRQQLEDYTESPVFAAIDWMKQHTITPPGITVSHLPNLASMDRLANVSHINLTPTSTDPAIQSVSSFEISFLLRNMQPDHESGSSRSLFVGLDAFNLTRLKLTVSNLAVAVRSPLAIIY